MSRPFRVTGPLIGSIVAGVVGAASSAAPYVPSLAVPPTISLTASFVGGTSTAPASVLLAATPGATLPATVAKVEFLRGGAVIPAATKTSPPYTYTDPSLTAGSYSYTAKVTDSVGQTTLSALTVVTVSAAVVTSGSPVLVTSIADPLDVPRNLTTPLSGNFTDPNNDPLTFGVVASTPEVTMGAPPSDVPFVNGVFSPTGTAALGLSPYFMIYADDGKGAVDDVCTFSAVTTATSGVYPFMLGMGFRKGDVPDSVYVKELVPSAQVIVKRRWNDGSVKHAIISGRASLTQNTPRTFTLARGAHAPLTPLTAASIATAAPAASVQCGTIGTIALSSLLNQVATSGNGWTGLFRTWISGPEMVECHYRATVGTDIMVWFKVRLFADGRIWIREIVERGTVETLPQSVTPYVPTLSINSVNVFTNGGSSFNHWNHAAYKAEAWIGGDPQVIAMPSMQYLRDAKLIPNYFFRNPSSTFMNALSLTYTPGSNNDIPNDFSATGFETQIGLLPMWDALCASSGDTRAWKYMQANNWALRSFGYTWRSNVTKEVMRPSAYPGYTTGGSGAGADSANLTTYKQDGSLKLLWENAHPPSAGYLPYLITGDHDMLELMQFSGALCYLNTLPSSGQGTARYIYGPARIIAWGTKCYGLAAALSPDSDAVASDMRSLCAVTNQAWDGVARTPGGSPIGVPTTTTWASEYAVNGPPYSTNPTKMAASLWMYYFWGMTLGLLWDVEPGYTDTSLHNNVAGQLSRHQRLRDFLYRIPIGASQSAAAFSTTVSIIGPEYPSFVNPQANASPDHFYQTWDEVFSNSSLPAASAWTTIGNTGGASVPIVACIGYVGEFMPALAYAVDHGAVDHLGRTAQDQWNRLVSASNWNDVVTSAMQTPPYQNYGFNEIPIWGIVPRNWNG